MECSMKERMSKVEDDVSELKTRQAISDERILNTQCHIEKASENIDMLSKNNLEMQLHTKQLQKDREEHEKRIKTAEGKTQSILDARNKESNARNFLQKYWVVLSLIVMLVLSNFPNLKTLVGL